MKELYYYQIDGVCYGEPRELMSDEATEKNAQLEKMMSKARWLRQHEFCWIDEVKM